MTDISNDRPVLNGRYELHRRIARGGMADVFLARDQLLDRPVAVKILFPQYAAEPTFVARFRREAQAAANLNHPSIVAVYDWGHHDDTYFIVMEYVEGQSLAELLAEEGPLDSVRAAEMATDVAAALGFAHRNGTVHRDVKPGNIMITPDEKVKVADFGIARAFGGADDQLTQTGSVMGTASYFSPEQAQGKQVDPRSDLYSLGVVLFEMVTGQTPFTGESPVAIAYKHVQETPPRPSSLNPAVPSEVENIIARLLAKNPDNRYETAEDFRTDLRRFQEGEPLTEAPAAAMSGATQNATTAMGVSSPPSNSRAVIDTTRAVPASVARGQAEPVEEFYEPPNRTGVFIVLLAFLLLLFVGLVVFILSQFGGDGTEPTNDVEIPNVIGLSESDAKNELEKLELVPVPELGESDEPPGVVFDQNPEEGGDKVAPKTEVTIFVSEADDTIIVPQLQGESESDAVKTLRDLGLKPDVKKEPSDTVPEGTVISTSPSADQKVNPDSEVTVTVSSGPDSTIVPDVSGLSQSDALAALEKEGITDSKVESESSDDVEVGKVIRTNPSAGSSISNGGRVTVFISKGADEKTVPNVTGKDFDEDEARAILNGAGFSKVVVSQRETDDNSRVGTVIDQEPKANSSHKTSDPVTIFIGKASTTPTTGGPSTTAGGPTTATSAPEEEEE